MCQLNEPFVVTYQQLEVKIFNFKWCWNERIKIILSSCLLYVHPLIIDAALLIYNYLITLAWLTNRKCVFSIDDPIHLLAVKIRYRSYINLGSHLLCSWLDWNLIVWLSTVDLSNDVPCKTCPQGRQKVDHWGNWTRDR